MFADDNVDIMSLVGIFPLYPMFKRPLHMPSTGANENYVIGCSG